MAKFLTIRLLVAPLILLMMITITFFLVRLTPGDPFATEKALSPETRQALEEYFHLDKSLGAQYWNYLMQLKSGKLGPSMKQKNRTVNEIIADHLPTSFILGVTALTIALCIGISAGLISAIAPKSIFDYMAMGSVVLGISIPAFVIGPLLQMLFARYWTILPISGSASYAHFILPALALGLPFAARFARLTRTGMLEVLSENFIQTARSKGLREHTVILVHALRGGLLPVVSFLGPAIASVTTGSLVVEKIFNIPGLGREFVESALNRDYSMVMGTVIVYGFMIILCNLLTDLTYAVMDPRVREG